MFPVSSSSISSVTMPVCSSGTHKKWYHWLHYYSITQLLYRHKIVNDLFTGGESVSAGTFGKAFPVLRSQPVSNYSSHFDMGASVRILQRNRSRKRHEYTYVCIRA